MVNIVCGNWKLFLSTAPLVRKLLALYSSLQMLLYIKRICFYSKSKFRPTWLTRDVDDRLVLVHRVETQLRWKTIMSQFEESKFENISVRINIWKSWIYFPPALGCLSIGCLSTWAGQRRSKAGYSTWDIIYKMVLLRSSYSTFESIFVLVTVSYKDAKTSESES